MPRRQEVRSEETRGAILAAAGQLFAQRGFDGVTMREIARAAGCSHTTIYIYFKDKEALLHHLAMGPLQSLRVQMESTLHDEAQTPEARLKQMTQAFIQFCLANRTMYTILFMERAGRVDVDTPTSEVQRLRVHLFGLLRQAVGACLPRGVGEGRVLAYARIYFFTLHGILGLYTASPEPLAELLSRLAPTFDLAFDVLVAGFKQTADIGAN